MPYKLYYFPEDGSTPETEIPIVAEAIDVSNNSGNQLGDASHPLYINANGHFVPISISLEDLRVAINSMLDMEFSNNTLTITFTKPNISNQ